MSHIFYYLILFLLYYSITKAELNGNRLKAVLVDRQK
jgi:hypothetical protein